MVVLCVWCVCFFAAFRERVSHAYGHLFENQLYRRALFAQHRQTIMIAKLRKNQTIMIAKLRRKNA
jgi:hypothetical protein